MLKRERSTNATNPQRQQAARERFWQKTQQLQQVFADVDPDEVEAEIDKAIRAVRGKKKHEQSA